MLATGRIVVDTWCVSYREDCGGYMVCYLQGGIVMDTGCVIYREMWWIQGVLATGRIVVDTGCVSYREGL